MGIFIELRELDWKVKSCFWSQATTSLVSLLRRSLAQFLQTSLENRDGSQIGFDVSRRQYIWKETGSLANVLKWLNLGSQFFWGVRRNVSLLWIRNQPWCHKHQTLVLTNLVSRDYTNVPIDCKSLMCWFCYRSPLSESKRLDERNITETSVTAAS